MICCHWPPYFVSSARTSRAPLTAAWAKAMASLVTALRLVRTCSMVSLMKAFLPGNFSRAASKLPLPNSAMQAIAFFFTAMCPHDHLVDALGHFPVGALEVCRRDRDVDVALIVLVATCGSFPR